MTPEIIDTPEGPPDLPRIGTRQLNTLHALANVPVSVSEEEEAQMESEDKEKDSKVATDPTIEGKVHCVSPPVDEEDIDDKEDNEDDNNNKENDDDDDEDEEDNDEGDDNNDTDDDEEEGIFDFDLNGMSKYELLRLRRVNRNNARLASLGLLEVRMSMAYPSANRTNRKKRVATQGDFVRRIQPKRNVFRPTSYKDLDDPVISKRTHSIDFSYTGEEDTSQQEDGRGRVQPQQWRQRGGE
jgi:hypothetical protein